MINDTRSAVITQVDMLSDDDIAQMDSRRAWIVEYPGFSGDLQTIEGKLGLIEAVLQDKAVAGEATTLQALGIVLGDAIAHKKAMAWYMMTTGMGRGPGLGVPGTDIKILPLTFIRDHVARGEAVDVQETFAFFCDAVDDMKRQAGMA